MPIWSAEIKELEKLYESFKGQIPDLEKELERLLKTDDENIILVYSRRCLEVIITDLCECELKRPRKTEPLKGIIDKLNKEEKVPSNIITSMDHLNSLSAYGAHPKDFDPEQVKPVLVNLDIIIKWYLKYNEIKINITGKSVEVKDELKISDGTTEHTHKPNKKLILLLSGVALVVAIVIIALFVFNIIGSGRQIKYLEKSIAVLPFFNDSQDQENAQYINGMMDEILNNLQRIKEFRVPSRTSTEQYRGESKPPIPEIARQLDVNYIVEGSGQKYGNTIRLRVQLIVVDKGRESHMWGESYEQDISDAKNYFLLQSRIAESIAEELKTIITPEEKELIEKTQTANLNAYDFYQRGREEQIKYWNENNRESLRNAENLYRKALQYDSTYARAYTGLAWVYWNKHFFNDYMSTDFMDSVLILCDRALSIDQQLSEAHTLRGTYYSQTGRSDLATKEFNIAIKLNPNDWIAYRGIGEFYHEIEWVKSIDNYRKAASINRGPEITDLFSKLAYAYASAGFPEKARQYIRDKLKLDGDSADYYTESSRFESWLGNNNKSLEYSEKAYKIDSTNLVILTRLADSYSWLKQFKESLKYWEKYIEGLKRQGDLQAMHHLTRIGYAYWQNNDRKTAEYYFDEQKRFCEKAIEEGREYERNLYTYYDLAGLYAFRGDRNKAFENLQLFNKKPMMSLWMVSLIKTDPLFNSIRIDPEFQQIVSDVEAKYQAEHERVRKWLEEQGML